MKFFKGLLIVASLALSAISTPVQQESGLVARGFDELEARAFDGGLMMREFEAAYVDEVNVAEGLEEQSLEERADPSTDAETNNAISADIIKIIWLLKLVIKKCTELGGAIKLLSTSCNFWQLFVRTVFFSPMFRSRVGLISLAQVIKKKFFALIKAIIILIKFIKSCNPCATGIEAKKILEIICILVQCIQFLLKCLCDVKQLLQKLGVIFIIKLLLQELLFIILVLFEVLVWLVKVDGGIVAKVLDLQNTTKSAILATIDVFAQA